MLTEAEILAANAYDAAIAGRGTGAKTRAKGEPKRARKKLHAADLLALLAERHAKDIFVPECKDGPTHTAEHRRMDAWVMRRSWTNSKVWAYEIKSSRSDFLRDDKWHHYLECCNEFYFVCPHGLIAPDEVAADAGLLWASRNGARLLMKKKAPVRTGGIPENVYRYILMARCNIGHPNVWEDDRAYWARWIEERRIDFEFGRRVSKAIAASVEEQIETVRRENERLQARIDSLEHLEARARELGFDPTRPLSSWQVRNRLGELSEAVPAEVREAIRGLARALPGLKALLESLESGPT